MPLGFFACARPSRRFGIHKAGNQAGLRTTGEHMNRLLTTFELQRHTASELNALFQQASQALVQTCSGTPERRIALASLENISRVLALSLAKKPGF
jgi:hypothetical protein